MKQRAHQNFSERATRWIRISALASLVAMFCGGSPPAFADLDLPWYVTPHEEVQIYEADNDTLSKMQGTLERELPGLEELGASIAALNAKTRDPKQVTYDTMESFYCDTHKKEIGDTMTAVLSGIQMLGPVGRTLFSESALKADNINVQLFDGGTCHWPVYAEDLEILGGLISELDYTFQERLRRTQQKLDMIKKQLTLREPVPEPVLAVPAATAPDVTVVAVQPLHRARSRPLPAVPAPAPAPVPSSSPSVSAQPAAQGDCPHTSPEPSFDRIQVLDLNLRILNQFRKDLNAEPTVIKTWGG